MAALSDEVKLFIVQALACFDTPTQVSKAVKEEFGLDVLRQQVAAYDPNCFVGRRLSQKWRTVFEDTRKKFREEVAEIPIASRAYRLRALARMAQQAEGMRNIALAVQVIEQAAKEVGDIYVNRRLDTNKTPGTDASSIPAVPEYVLKPDEDVPDNPIL
ncbi:DUF2280 domain-containing protein [Undibacterium sp. TJN19]|uniref:DUF2280 domain-containing protein n=1 Tax=Undibacterium sp. TJN19 TaxID=3413055 RepID=UPI003BF1CDB0